MATIKYLLQSKSDNSPIYLRLSLSKQGSLKRKTGLHISHKSWSQTTGLPKQNENSNKILGKKLRKLSDKILDKVDDANSKGDIIDGDWLSYQIELHFGRISINKRSEVVTDLIQDIIDNAHLRENSKGGIGLSTSRINSYKQLKKFIKIFQSKKQLKFSQVNKKVFDNFKKWMIDGKGYASTYAFKKLADLKTVCKEARKEGLEVNQEIFDIKTKKISAYDDDMNVIILNPQEIELIEKAKLISMAHINARKWLILACYTGQRGEDLIERIIDKNFQDYNGNLIINIKQQKGNKPVIIPVLPKVEEIYKKGLPYPVSTQKLNKYFKEIGKIAGVDEMVMGRLRDKKTKRGVKKLRPKYLYISTHIGRRSFASNHYGKIPTPLLMKVTNHQKESTFLSYINQADDSHIEPFLEFYKSRNSEKGKENMGNGKSNAI